MLDFIRVGEIVNTHGIKGAIKCISLTDDNERFNELEYIYTEMDNEKRIIENIWYKKGLIYIKLEGINSINEAEKYRNSYILIDKNQTKKLPDDTYYIHEIEGLKVFTITGIYIGIVTKVLQTGANDVYVVKDGKKQNLIPAIKKIIKEINIQENKIIIEPIKGLIEWKLMW